jgi:hypothetical protein
VGEGVDLKKPENLLKNFNLVVKTNFINLKAFNFSEQQWVWNGGHSTS